MKLTIDIPQKVVTAIQNGEDYRFDIHTAIAQGIPYEERPQGEWIVTAEDNEGIHRIQCPFCRYEKGSDFIDYITVTFEKLPPFCESCGAELRGGDNE